MQMLLKKAVESLPESNMDLADFDELVDLDNLAKSCLAPEPSDLTSAVLDCHLDVGGVRFQALTIAGRIWARDVGVPATKSDPLLSSLVIPFAMANRKKIMQLADHGQVKRAVRLWVWWKCRKLTEAQLLYVLRWFGMIDDDSDDAEPTPDQYGTLLALLVKEYGSTPAYWLHDAPIEVVTACLNDVMIKTYYEHESVRKAAAASGKAIAPDPNSPQVVAYTKFINRLRVYQAKRMPTHGE